MKPPFVPPPPPPPPVTLDVLFSVDVHTLLPHVEVIKFGKKNNIS